MHAAFAAVRLALTLLAQQDRQELGGRAELHEHPEASASPTTRGTTLHVLRHLIGGRPEAPQAAGPPARRPRARRGARTTLAEPGAAVWIPRGTRHTFTVKTETSRALNFYTPGGFDESISMLATPATARTLPPPASGEQDLC